MIRVGVVGLGFMGWIHWLAYQKLRGVKVAAVCDPKPRRLAGDWRGLRGNFGPPGEQVDVQGAAGYLNWHDLIRDPAIDLVDITLPTALHAEVAIAALAAGKHVLCEKPMALCTKDCRRMMRAAKKSERLLMVAHVLPFFPEYAWALKAIRSGKFGELRQVWLKRIIDEPKWLANYWLADQVGGPMFDLHVHDAHFIRLLFGKPTSVRTTGRLRGGLPELWVSRLQFSGRPFAVQVIGGVIDEPRISFSHAFQISSLRRTMKFEFEILDNNPHYVYEPHIVGADGRTRLAKLRRGEPLDAFVTELREAVRCVRNQCSSEYLNPELALDAIRICEAETKSLVSGRTVRL